MKSSRINDIKVAVVVVEVTGEGQTVLTCVVTQTGLPACPVWRLTCGFEGGGGGETRKFSKIKSNNRSLKRNERT